MKVKEESEKVGLKLNIQKTKIMASGPITSWQISFNYTRVWQWPLLPHLHRSTRRPGLERRRCSLRPLEGFSTLPPKAIPTSWVHTLSQHTPSSLLISADCARFKRWLETRDDILDRKEDQLLNPCLQHWTFPMDLGIWKSTWRIWLFIHIKDHMGRLLWWSSG